MNSDSGAYPTPDPRPAHAPAGWNPAQRPPFLPPHPVVVQVQAKSGGLTRAVLFMLGLALFAIVFVAGIGFGIAAMLAGAEYSEVVLHQPYREGSGRSLAIIPIEGDIDERQSAFMRACVDEVINSRAFAGVVLRVDSPGGGVSASDQIWNEVQRLKKAGLPVVASFGGVAASGGYYVACSADSIIAEQTCITGSIGVIAQVLTFSGTMDKIGVEPVTIVASGSPEKNTANDPFRQWNQEDRRSVQVMLDAAYDIFLTRVKDGRAAAITAEDSLRSVADGSIFTADQALKNGLVDAIGYLDDAVTSLESRCGIPAGRANVVRLTLPPSLFGDGLLGINSRSSATPAEDMLTGTSLRRMMQELATPRVMYRMH